VLPDDEADKLSDYIPGSNEVSRVPSRQATASDEEEEEEEEEEVDEVEEDEEYDEAGDAVMKPKTASVLRKEAESRERKSVVTKKKAAKKDMEDQVRPFSRAGVH
jgi:SWI/SNF-related matrix-associated actin-dependent regulator of chromatin subfamily A member 5